jgi:hypothetical protein
VRPEAWLVHSAPHDGLAARLLKQAYLGNGQELTLATALGEIFVVLADVERRWSIGDNLVLTLPGSHGVSVVRAGAAA